MAIDQATETDGPVAITPLLKRADFLRLRSGRKFSGKFFTLQAKSGPAGSGATRVGITVTTKVGNAVIRNRIKRRLRDSASLALSSAGRSGHDYVLIARRPTLRAEFSALLNELYLALDRVHGNGAKGNGKSGGFRNKAS